MSSGWKRSSGQFSSKAKKEYLKWKRAQKRESSDANSEDEQLPETNAAQAQPGARQRLAAAPSDNALQYVDLESFGGMGSLVQLPRCVLEEVGLATTGVKLGMPQRPAWRGIVQTAEQLQELEEASFNNWLQEVEERSGSVQVGFYEKRLEFWRQLWRVLDRSHVVLMLLDARNPLFHFSEALYTHATKDLGLAVVLVLNKCDLVPPASVEAWEQWFAANYRMAKVVSASAAAKDATVCAQHILEAVLGTFVSWSGKVVQARDVVAASAAEILNESRVRNAPNRSTATGRRDPPGPPAPARQHNRQKDAVRDDRHAPDVRGFKAAARQDRDDSDGSDDWQLKGTKARRKAAVKAKRSQRQHGGASNAVAAEDKEGEGSHHKGSSSRSGMGAGHQGSRDGTEVRLHQSSVRRLGGAGGDDGVDGDDDCTASTSAGEDERRHSRNGAGAKRHMNGRPPTGQAAVDSGEDEGTASGGSEDAEEDDENANQEFEGMGEDAFLVEERVCASSGAAMTAAARGLAERSSGGRPLVVCVCGEPNVGKSSIMNILLGSHKVAVSSHPGRTKHYQTHYMTSRLMLCDCPGLVFPRQGVPLPMQVLYGSYPIARCRDPYSVVHYLAERLWPRIPDLCGLTREMAEKGETQCESWSTLGICEALAVKQGWRSKRSGRLDTYKAANWLLRSALAGRNGMNLCFLPPVPQQAASVQEEQAGLRQEDA